MVSLFVNLDFIQRTPRGMFFFHFARTQSELCELDFVVVVEQSKLSVSFLIFTLRFIIKIILNIVMMSLLVG